MRPATTPRFERLAKSTSRSPPTRRSLSKHCPKTSNRRSNLAPATAAFLYHPPSYVPEVDPHPFEAPSRTSSTLKIILNDVVGQGRTSTVFTAHVTDTATEAPLTSLTLVGKLVEGDRIFDVARESIFYTDVVPHLLESVRSLLPAYLGTFADPGGQWAVILFEDVGRVTTPSGYDEHFQLDTNEARSALSAFAMLDEAGISHNDRRWPNVAFKDGKARVLGFGTVTLELI